MPNEIKRFKELLDKFNKLDYLPIALADITFKFPNDCKYPSLSLRVDNFGLINPLEGRTVATLPEIELALYQGCKIDYHDAVVIENYEPLIQDINKNDTFVFSGYLYELFILRKEAKDNNQELLQAIFKNCTNNCYGKLAQGITKKSSFNTREGTTTPLPKSAITNSYYASMTTGLIRSALSAMIIALDELINEGYNYVIISATTDGLLYGIDEKIVDINNILVQDDKYNSTFEALNNGYNKFKPFHIVDPILSKRLLKFNSLRLLQLSHEMWRDDTYIEIKHTANKVLNFKTRGQIGYYDDGINSICTILAKAGHKISGDKNQQAKWIEKHYADEVINKYKFNTLSSIQEIINEDCPIDDLVSLPQERVISLDYDYKRYPIDAHFTAPHKDINQFSKYRQSADYLKRLGQRATIDNVDYKYKRAEQKVRKTGSNKAFVVRHMIRALMNNVKPFIKPNLSYFAIANKLKSFGVTLNLLKKSKSTIFSPFMIPDTTQTRALIRKILRTLEYETSSNYSDFLELLLYKKISNPDEVSYLD